ncbi:hypothetical protein [Caulobacter sp. RL271]|uniref:Porin n=1 Tax=Caulobacter segnis TaxID=88688 RepID=A0ABY4ZTX1_9CAUL|nr:hypothetical protein [Caulobacter segnis]USQ96079.1 hypothetical protein MZV50_00270 [Caulobacter segnis]
MIRALALTVGLTVGLTFAARAHAQTIPAYPPITKAPNLSAPLNLKPVAPVPLNYAQAPTPLPRGVARTAIERREGGISGGVGVLCGIQPSADTSGVGAARGYDNEGRFVGAKLGFSF